MSNTPKVCNVWKLITAVQKYPALYDIKDEDFTNKHLRTKLWKKVAQECHAENEHYAKKRWQSLKDYYNKLRRKRSLDNRKKKIEFWRYSRKLEFLNKRDNGEKTTDMADKSNALITFSNNEDEGSLTENIQEEHTSNECSNLNANSCESNEVPDFQISEGRDEQASIALLIRTVKNYQKLYDRPENSSADLKNKLWQRVAMESKFGNAALCQKKWKNIRDYYCKLLRYQEKDSGARLQKWHHSKEMKFMDSFLRKSASRTTPDNSSSDMDEPLTLYSSKDYENQLKAVETTNKMITDYLEKKGKQTEKIANNDSLSTFFKSMEDLVRKFSITRQLEAKCKISALIFGIEADEMKARSGICDNSIVPMNTSAPGPSSAVFVNNSNNCNLPFQNHNVYPSYPPQPHLTAQQFTQQLVPYANQPMHFQQRMSNLSKK